MPPSDLPTFESLRDDLSGFEPSTSRDERTIRWVDRGGTLAYSRDQDGRLELFLVGPPLHAHEPRVRERLVHDAWVTAAGATLSASRIWLPEGVHYDAVAATILIELLDHGYPSDTEGAFRRTEPLIAIVLDQVRAENAVLTGLAGELLLLTSLMREPAAPSPETVLDAWQGWDRSTRDFQLGPVGVEVKATTTTVSRHHIQGWYQVERGVAADGGVETRLYLLSLGIQWLPESANGHTIEKLVHQVLAAVPGHRHDAFLDAVRNYAGGRLDIDAHGAPGRKGTRRPFVPIFERLYDLVDERIHILESQDLAAFGNVVTDSVHFEIQLPDSVRGDRNPITGMPSIVPAILRAAAE